MNIPRTRRPSMLLVDDEEDILSALRMCMARMLPGVDLETATSGAQALEILRRRPVDLIVTDFRMPGMNGLEFLREATKLAPATPRIMISAYPTPDLVAQAGGEYGIRLFIAKPFDMDYFAEILDGILMRGT
ncbi:MAG: response regulator [Halobacteriales archaeon]|nr:response regulator [Halobacteriales archaeon]